MLYFFTWNSDFLIKEQIKAWKSKFIWKFWDFNLVEIKNLEEVDNNFLVENLTSRSFLDEKKLIIINVEQGKKSEKEEQKRDFILSILDKISEENIVLFYLIHPDKRSKLYKWFKAACETKEFSIQENQEIKQIIRSKYPDQISPNAIDTIIQYKSWNLSKIISEIEKLLITINYIEPKNITDNIAAELEESIFQIIDDILNKNIISAIKKIDITLHDINVYAFYNNLLANLRTTTYILKYKHFDIEPRNIWIKLNLWNRSFLTTKTYKVFPKELENLYISLINLDKKMKTGNLIWSEDEVFQNEIEKCILKLH